MDVNEMMGWGTSQMLDLTEDEMLALCKRVMNLEPGRRDCVVERDDGIDIDEWLRVRARTWYAQLLEDAPLAWLPVEDVKALVTATLMPDGAVKAIVPAQCVRPVEWQLDGWKCGVTAFARPDDATGRLQRNPWTRAGVHCPVAVDHGAWLMLYGNGGTAQPVVTMARCVVRPTDGRYRFHTAAIASLPAALNVPTP